MKENKFVKYAAEAIKEYKSLLIRLANEDKYLDFSKKKKK